MIRPIEPISFLDQSPSVPVIDVRSPGEFGHGHVPGAVNIPLFDDDERAVIGTLYVKSGREAAILKGLDLALPRTAMFIRSLYGVLSNPGNILIYCWRGGLRSAMMAEVFNRAGYEIGLLTGGYKAYRRFIREAFARPASIIVLGGYTGSGKTDLLKAISIQGEQVIDLEGLACHKGSVFGALGQSAQPTNEQFENNLYARWSELDFNRQVWIEDESRMIGRVTMPDAVAEHISNGTMIRVELDIFVRIQRLVKEYAEFDVKELTRAIARIGERLGGEKTKQAISALENHRFEEVASIALSYYDKAYQFAMARRRNNNVHQISIPGMDPETDAARIIELACKIYKMDTIYLDYNATTPIDPLVIEAIRPYLEDHFGNPSSAHRYGAQAKIAVEKARSQVASLLNARSDEIIFTSGGSESNNFAIKGVAFAQGSKGNHIITTSIEHPAVTEVCRFLENNGFRITWLPVDEYGMVNPLEVEKAITPQTILITVMHANNETGTVQPLEAIGKIAREHGVLLHTDAAQSVGKIPVNVENLQVDLLSVAGHKLYAPKGVGALYIRRGVRLEKLIHGADHESNLRAGTENVMEIVGLGKAADLAAQMLIREVGSAIRDAEHRIRDLRDRLHTGIRRAIPEIRLNGHPEFRLPNTLSLAFPGVEATMLLEEMKGIAASAGAACHADQTDISGVLAAMSVPREFAIGTIRFSVGRMTTLEEIDTAIPIVVNAYRRIKGVGLSEDYRIPDAEDERQITNHISRNPVPVSQLANPALKLTEPASRICLTDYTHALGCACKIRPQLLEQILKGIPGKKNPAILVGHETADDAAVYMINEDTAIVQTVDFIPPVVDDPYMYGAIAAANALSDVYAMGGKPLFALSIVGFPDRRLPLAVLQQIIRGANDKAAEAGIQVVGGHSIEDHEPKFGLVVTGIIHPAKILRNSTARAGDALVLTKPLGTGIITTAIKQGLADKTAIEKVMQVMAELNSVPAEIMSRYPVNACTDVTGFGLLGHLKEMVTGAGLQVQLNADCVPVIDSAWEYAAAGAIPGGTKNNLIYVKELVHWNERTPELMKFILADAQTSGGLLISLPAHQAIDLVESLHRAGITSAAIIGKWSEGRPAIMV
jgi:cysteine desulfurase